MFHRKAGEYTIEEFNQALDEYVKSQSHPKTFVYIRALIEGEMEDEALKRFKEDLFDRVGHYWCNYATDDAMKLHFVMQNYTRNGKVSTDWRAGCSILLYPPTS